MTPAPSTSLLGVHPVEVGDDALHLDLRVGRAQVPLGRHGLGQIVGDVLLGIEQLPVQVVILDEVAVDHAHPAHPGAHQRAGDHRAERPAAHHHREALAQPALPLGPDTREDGLP